MCTVSYIPHKEKGFILTSNRDERAFRPTMAPQIYTIRAIRVGFPKDARAGGSWIAANDRGRLCCLLNGGFTAHHKNSHYAQSRGTVLLELISSASEVQHFFQQKDLSDIEPFTMISLQWKNPMVEQLSQLVWDGKLAHFRLLNPLESFLWSSVTLYSEEHRQLRKQWFGRFLLEQSGKFTPESILEFHSGKHTLDQTVNLLMERKGDLKTVSITQVIPEDDRFRMKYLDLHLLEEAELEIGLA